jgi:glycosyltransferase involved in cell wall biosynthesis
MIGQPSPILGSGPRAPGDGIPTRGHTLRICFMIDQLGRGGTECQVLALIRGLDRGRVRPSLCLLNGDDVESRSLEPDDCPVLRLGVRSLRHVATPLKALRLARFLRRERVDMLHVYFPDSTYLGALVARLAGVRCVVRNRRDLGYWMTPAHRRLGRLYNRLVDATLANCNECRQSVLADEAPAPESVFVLENGVDLSRFGSIPPLDPSDAGANPRVVGALANLRPEKDLELFLRAARDVGLDHPHVSFRIAGEGESRPELERCVDELGLRGRVDLPGSVADVPAFLAGLDIAVLSSRTEGLSNALLEYMAAGRAIVTTAVGAARNLIEDGVNGLVVPPGDQARLAGAIDRLLHDPALVARLGAAARRHAHERYSLEAKTLEFEALCRGLIERRAPDRRRARVEARAR